MLFSLQKCIIPLLEIVVMRDLTQLIEELSVPYALISEQRTLTLHLRRVLWRSDLVSMNIENAFLKRVYKLGTNRLEGRYLRHLGLSQQNYFPLAFILANPWGHIAPEMVRNGHFSHM